jgi:ParB/RepB/Spo0J family partition protein
MDLQILPVDALNPNPWSPNRLDEEQYDSLLADVTRRGQVLKPVVVRPDTTSGRFLILDGEHQWRAARDAGLTSVPCQVLEADDFEARRATIRRNLHGTTCPLRFGRLCAEMFALRPELSGRALAKELGVDPHTIRDGLTYQRLAAMGAERTGLSEEQIAALPVRKARALLKRLEQEDEPQEGSEAPVVGVAPPAEHSRTVKAMAKALLKLVGLCGEATIEERAVFWRAGGQRQIAELVRGLETATQAATACPAPEAVPNPAPFGKPEAVVRKAAPTPERLRDVPQMEGAAQEEAPKRKSRTKTKRRKSDDVAPAPQAEEVPTVEAWHQPRVHKRKTVEGIECLQVEGSGRRVFERHGWRVVEHNYVAPPEGVVLEDRPKLPVQVPAPEVLEKLAADLHAIGKRATGHLAGGYIYRYDPPTKNTPTAAFTCFSEDGPGTGLWRFNRYFDGVEPTPSPR